MQQSLICIQALGHSHSCRHGSDHHMLLQLMACSLLMLGAAAAERAPCPMQGKPHSNPGTCGLELGETQGNRFSYLSEPEFLQSHISRWELPHQEMPLWSSLPAPHKRWSHCNPQRPPNTIGSDLFKLQLPGGMRTGAHRLLCTPLPPLLSALHQLSCA